MLTRRIFLMGASVAGVGLLAGKFSSFFAAEAAVHTEQFAVHYTDEEWHQRLSSAQYRVLREEGTEPPYTSPLNDEHRSGIFSCAGCQLELFSSSTKFDSHTGWPSFWQPLENAVAQRRDSSLGMVRDEVHCRRCGGHLGHVFDDGPAPTGLRYCMNGLAMLFTADKK